MGFNECPMVKVVRESVIDSGNNPLRRTLDSFLGLQLV
jgi:hypothetical protein